MRDGLTFVYSVLPERGVGWAPERLSRLFHDVESSFVQATHGRENIWVGGLLSQRDLLEEEWGG